MNSKKVEELQMYEDLHDSKFRRENKEPIDAFHGSDGKWYSNKMQESRRKDKLVKIKTDEILHRKKQDILETTGLNISIKQNQGGHF